MNDNTISSITEPNVFLKGTFSIILASSLVIPVCGNDKEQLSLFENQPYSNFDKEPSLNQNYINDNYTSSNGQKFYDSIINKPLDKQVLINLISDAHTEITSYSLLEANDKNNLKVEDYFNTIEQKKKSRIIFKKRNC